MTHEIICDVMAALVKGPRTASDLAEMCLGGDYGQRLAINALREAGLVRVSGYMDSPLGGRMLAVYEFQRTPFELSDAPLTPTQVKAREKYARKVRGRAA